MTLTALDKAKRQLRKRPVHLTVKVMIDPATGERCRAFVATHPVDQRSLQERGFRTGMELVADNLRHSRNPKFHRLAHKLGGFLADHTEMFHGLTMHDALKKLQTESGIGASSEAYTFELPEFGTVSGTRAVAESLNFLDMDEGRFRELWDGGPAAAGEGGWMGWLRAKIWPGLTRETIDAAERLITPKP